jgi:hypothetical protein
MRTTRILCKEMINILFDEQIYSELLFINNITESGPATDLFLTIT